MINLPDNWMRSELGDILDIQGGSQPPKSTFLYSPKDGYVQLLQIRDFGEKSVPTYVPIKKVSKFCKKDDVLIARYGASLGRIVTGQEGAYNVALAKVIDLYNVFNKRYIFFLLKTSVFQTPLSLLSRSAQNGFAKHEIAHIQLPIPPKAEQHRIVAKIEELFSELDKGVETLKTAQKQLKVYRQSLLHHAFSALSTEKTIEEVIENSTIGLVRSISELVEKNKGVPYIKMNNVDMDGRVNYSSLTYVRVNHLELSKYCLKEGDILINTRNSFELVGKTGIVRNPPENTVFNNNLLRLRLKSAYNPQFICFQMTSPFFRKQMVTEKKATTNVCALYQRDIFPLKVKICDLETQNLVVKKMESRLSVCEKIEESIEQGLQQAEALRQSILKKAFEGKLVPQDPKDEPASVLLERIKAERAFIQPSKKTKTTKTKKYYE